MTHRRIAASAVAAGDDLDQAVYVDEYKCDGCGAKFNHHSQVRRVQGQVFTSDPAGSGMLQLNADVCFSCFGTATLAELLAASQ